jgi:TPR repeat protein
MRCLWCWSLIALSLLLTDAAIAGPFEDAVAAYRRKDYGSALSQFRSLAEQGDTRALGNLGVMYSHGEGVPQDYAEAVGIGAGRS